MEFNQRPKSPFLTPKLQCPHVKPKVWIPKHHHETVSDAKAESLLRVNTGHPVGLKQQQQQEQHRRDLEWQTEGVYVGEEA